MLDRISEMIAMFLVGLGQFLSRMTPEEESMITLLLAFMLIAATAARVLYVLQPFR